MIVNANIVPKSITLVRLRGTTPGQVPSVQLADIIPIALADTTDARAWRPDVATSKTWGYSTELQSAPIASGQRVNTHARRNPITVAFTGWLTDTPFVPFQGNIATTYNARRADQLWANLRTLWRERAFLSVIAATEVIEVAQIEDLQLVQAPDDGAAYQVQVSIREQQTYDLVTLPSVDDALDQLGATIYRTGGVVVGAA